ncbi:hypothetical protein [Gluconacetobacter tumulicola]|uniref:Uncharacterized protein n=1 Tax=Gluconacetobacter tumulicola TaxID=1017177 RepID=A0A7W4JAG0_9PROT|nr:hypothetical protein [Gluconacetobacter tumulicola]MBB2177648.1 hypothetical protein [Gluconacetobacter tumulicola]
MLIASVSADREGSAKVLGQKKDGAEAPPSLGRKRPRSSRSNEMLQRDSDGSNHF